MQIRSHVSSFLGLLLLAAACPATIAAERWTQFTSFTTITTLADAGSHLWLGTPGGLIRLDKSTWEKTYFHPANSALTDYAIQAVASDGKGRMAAITRSGALAEFDGRNWSNLGGALASPPHRPLDIVWGPGGTLWVLAASEETHLPGLFRRRDGHWLHIPLPGTAPLAAEQYYRNWPFINGPFYSWPLSLQVDGEDRAFVLAASRDKKPTAYRAVIDGQVDTMPLPQHLYPRNFVVPRSGPPIWICAAPRVLATPSAAGWDTVQYPDSEVTSFIIATPRHAFARDIDGSEFLVLRQLLHRRAGVWEAETRPGEATQNYPLLILEPAPDGAHGKKNHRLYAAREDNLGILTDSGWTFIDITHMPLGDMNYHTLAARRDGGGGILLGGNFGLWEMRTPDAGVRRLNLGAWGGTILRAMAEDRRGRFWLSGQEGLALVESGQAKTLEPPDGPWNTFTANYGRAARFLAEDSAGTLWLADSMRLLAVPEGDDSPGSWKSHWLPEPWKTGSRIAAVSAHPDGSIWIAAQNPGRRLNLLARHDGKAWTRLDTFPSPKVGYNLVRELRCDSAGHVWSLIDDELLQWDGSGWKSHPRTPTPHLATQVTALAVDPAGHIWAATAPPRGALLRWNGGWEPVPETGARLATTRILAMDFDASGRLWMSTSAALEARPTAADGVTIYDPSGEPTAAVPPAPRKAIGRASPARNTDGTWRPVAGVLAVEEGSTLRLRDLLGREVFGRGAR